MRVKMLILCLGCGLLGACANKAPKPQPPTAGQPVPATHSSPIRADSHPIGVMAEMPKNSPFAKIEKGMSEGRVYNLIGQPTETKTYLTGKQWIPFYFGPDVHRKEAYYKGLGRIVFVPSGAMGTGVYKVHQVIYDPTEDGYAD